VTSPNRRSAVGYVAIANDRWLPVEIQHETLRRIASERGWELARVFAEVEPDDGTRPELGRALRFAQRRGATLVVAALDRLVTDRELVDRLYHSGTRPVFGDIPQADESPAGRATVDAFGAAMNVRKQRRSEIAKASLAVVSYHSTHDAPIFFQFTKTCQGLITTFRTSPAE
jgi:DNA invertase Pin-like site-specific DNA recombinase